jgi:hypothetical protein
MRKHSSVPTESRLGVELSFDRDWYPGERLNFQLTLRNRSSASIVIDRYFHERRNLFLDLRTLGGKAISELQDGDAVYLGYSGPCWDELMDLAPGEALTHRIDWQKHFFYRPRGYDCVCLRVVYCVTGLLAYLEVLWSRIVRTPRTELVDVLAVSNPCFAFFEPAGTRIVDDRWDLLLPLETPFLPEHMKLSIERCSETEALPYSKQGLFLVDPERRSLIREPNDLTGLVRIEDEASALAFVRLFSSVPTHYFFPSVNYLEAFPKEERPDEDFCVIPSFLWPKLGISLPTVRRVGDSYLIERTLLRYPRCPSETPTVYRSSERVTRTGEYRQRTRRVILESRPRDCHGPSIDVPYY